MRWASRRWWRNTLLIWLAAAIFGIAAGLAKVSLGEPLSRPTIACLDLESWQESRSARRRADQDQLNYLLSRFCVVMPSVTSVSVVKQSVYAGWAKIRYKRKDGTLSPHTVFIDRDAIQ